MPYKQQKRVGGLSNSDKRHTSKLDFLCCSKATHVGNHPKMGHTAERYERRCNDFGNKK